MDHSNDGGATDSTINNDSVDGYYPQTPTDDVIIVDSDTPVHIKHEDTDDDEVQHDVAPRTSSPPAANATQYATHTNNNDVSQGQGAYEESNGAAAEMEDYENIDIMQPLDVFDSEALMQEMQDHQAQAEADLEQLLNEQTEIYNQLMNLPWTSLQQIHDYTAYQTEEKVARIHHVEQ
ncbi:hypothetical protein HDV05_007781, partial [Chytridiales sp. JEL 0842]